MKRLLVNLVLITLFLSLLSCKKTTITDDQTNKIRVITTLFPLYDFSKNIGRDKVEVTLILPPGAESHSFEPTPEHIMKINDSHLLIYTGTFMERWINNIIKENKGKPLLVDASKNTRLIKADHSHNHDQLNIDPHIWLDFDNVKFIIENIAEGLISLNPENRDFFLKNKIELLAKIEELDSRYKKTLSNCKYKTVLFGGHNTFSYLARKYDINFIPLYKGIQPEEEPSPKRMIEMIEKIRKMKLKVIFYEEIENPKIAKVIASETDARLLKISSAHNITRDELEKNVSFLDIMNRNLEIFKEGLVCY